MKILPINKSTLKAYDELSRQLGSVFNTPEWLDLYQDQVARYGLFDNSDTLVGGFFLFEKKYCGLNYIKNPPFSPHIGLFLVNPAQNPAKANSFFKGAISDLADFILHLHAAVVSFAFDPSVIDLQPFIWKKFKVNPGYTYQISLQQPEEDLLAGFSAERRNDINKAMRDGVVVKQVSDYSVVKDLVVKTFNRKSENLDIAMVEKILSIFARPENSFAFVAYSDEKPVSCTFCLHHGLKVYYLLGGYDETNGHHGGGAFCIWESIRLARKLGCEIFDFEGSMIIPVEKYFRGFGGKITPYFTVNKAWLPLEMSLKLIKREVF